MLKPGDFDWARLFARGVRWFHSGGIFASLSETTAPLIIEGMQAARAAGAITSFDLNYRAKLWASVGGAERGQQVIKKIAGQLDALFGNEEDLQKGLGIAGPEVTSKSKLDPDTFFTLIERVVEQHPNIKLVATTLREVHSTNRHDWAAVVWLDGQRYVSPTCQLDVIDRIGGGDGFAAGPGLRAAFRAPAGRSPAARLGSWCAPDNVPRRRDHGQARRGGSAGQGRVGPRAAVISSPRRSATMLTAEGCAARRERLWGALPSPCDLLIVGDPSHLTYFAGYSPSPFVFRTVESGALLLLEPGRATLVADAMLGPFVERAFVDERVAPVWYDGQHSAPYRRGQLVAFDSRPAREHAREPDRRRARGRSRGGCRGTSGGAAAARDRRYRTPDSPVAAGQTCRRNRSAAQINASGEAGLAAALEKVRPGMTELDVYLIVQNAAMTELGEQVIVYGDFASGPRCARDKGGSPTSRKIEPGDLLLLDFSVIVSGYRGDFTNTFAVGGGPTPGQRELFEACVGALHAGEAAIKPGTAARDVDAAVRGHFRALGLDQYFPTHSGHGLGLGHPEPPYFVPRKQRHAPGRRRGRPRARFVCRREGRHAL